MKKSTYKKEHNGKLVRFVSLTTPYVKSNPIKLQCIDRLTNATSRVL